MGDAPKCSFVMNLGSTDFNQCNQSGFVFQKVEFSLCIFSKFDFHPRGSLWYIGDVS